VGEPLIYEGWGKNQTYIIAYSFTDAEDVTARYTTKFNESVARRVGDGVNQTVIDSALAYARAHLNEMNTSQLVQAI
jgi:hypothetical protein